MIVVYARHVRPSASWVCLSLSLTYEMLLCGLYRCTSRDVLHLTPAMYAMGLSISAVHSYCCQSICLSWTGSVYCIDL